MLKKYINKNKIILSLGVITSPGVLFIVSCGTASTPIEIPALENSYSFLNEFQTNEDKWFNNEQTVFDAKIVYWSDGDTPVIEWTGTNDAGEIIKPSITTQNSDISIENYPNRTSIRITTIDTLESNLPPNVTEPLDPVEVEWAKKASAFAKAEVPDETPIKLFTSQSTSFNRLVGSIFYQDDSVSGDVFKNYGVSIMEAGQAKPNINTDGIYFQGELSANYVLAKQTSLAYSHAKFNKRGIWSVDDLGTISIAHKPADYSNLDYSLKDRATSIYNIFKELGI